MLGSPSSLRAVKKLELGSDSDDELQQQAAILASATEPQLQPSLQSQPQSTRELEPEPERSFELLSAASLEDSPKEATRRDSGLNCSSDSLTLSSEALVQVAPPGVEGLECSDMSEAALAQPTQTTGPHVPLPATVTWVPRPMEQSSTSMSFVMVEERLQPRYSALPERHGDGGRALVQTTQGLMMHGVRTILETRVCFDRVSVVNSSAPLVCEGKNRPQRAIRHDLDAATKLYGPRLHNFYFRQPGPSSECVAAMASIRNAIEFQPGPVAFCVTIHKPEHAPHRFMERWMIVLDHTHGCALSRPEQLEDLRKSARVYKEAIVAMRTLYQFVRLMPGYRHYRTRLGTPARPGPRSGVLAEQPASSLEFNIERVSVHSVTATPRKKLHAMSVLTPFGRLSVDMEYSPMCEDISSPARLPSTTTTAPPPLSDSSLRRSHPSLLPEVPAVAVVPASAPAAESADGFLSLIHI